jgi:hypothetical protein
VLSTVCHAVFQLTAHTCTYYYCIVDHCTHKQRHLCAADPDSSGTLNREQFRQAALAAALGLGDIDLEQLFVTFGSHRSISIAALMQALTGSLSAQRARVVDAAFDALLATVSSSGSSGGSSSVAAAKDAVPIGQLLQQFRPARHPAVQVLSTVHTLVHAVLRCCMAVVSYLQRCVVQSRSKH